MFRNLAILGVVFLMAGCSDKDTTGPQLRELNARVEGLTKKLEAAEQKNADALTDIQSLQSALEEVKTSVEATNRRFQEIPRNELEASLGEFLDSRLQEILPKAIPSGSQLTKTSEPELQMPTVYNLPYSARIILTVEKEGKLNSIPLVLRADAEGKWQFPEDIAPLVEATPPASVPPVPAEKVSRQIIQGSMRDGGTKTIDLTSGAAANPPVPSPGGSPSVQTTPNTPAPAIPPVHSAPIPQKTGDPIPPARGGIPPGGRKEIDLRTNRDGSQGP